MPFIWTAHRHSPLFFYDVSNAPQFLLEKKKQELSEYKVIYMIKDYFLSLFQAITVGTEELLKILHRLYQLLKKKGRKCHRHKKMTVFDILGIVYKTTVKHRQAA
ncbi:putative transposase for insertion sequence element IS231B (plasmid) [Bacillus cereus E33L]|nr:putative transposase for insertion sequence element IS231B [Bacillus cereus E33L]